MRPVNHVTTGATLSKSGDPKPVLIAAMGEYCCYCERALAAMDLRVEHIEPERTHPHLALVWANYLLACSTCNSCKRHYQATNQPIDILLNQAWPQLDNTFSAYVYDQYGRVKVVPTLSTIPHTEMAQRTLEMAGLNKTPAADASYKKRGQIYDKISRRAKVWRNATGDLEAYLENPTDKLRNAILNHAEAAGFFSIWMAVFAAYPQIKNDLITLFKAAPECFDAQGNPINPRSLGRI